MNLKSDMVRVDNTGSGKKVLVAVLIVALLLVAGGTALSMWSAGQMQETVKRQFNEEQLVIARHVASLIERELKVLKREILLITKEMSSEPFNPEVLNRSIQKTLVRVVERGVRHINVIDTKSGKIYTYMPNQYWTVKDVAVQKPGRLPLTASENGENIKVGRPQIKSSQLSLELSVSLAGDLPKLLQLNVNLSWFLAPLLRDARSGKTGYAWVIDEKGSFLYHPDADFVGKNAFEIRKEKTPDLSFEKINLIQKKKMLMGQEGTGYYISGWHRGITGQIEKLIAFFPIVISETPPQKWSVAVVAPVSEVEAAVKDGYQRQFLLQGLIITIIVLAASTLIFIEKRWSRVLELKVSARTEALQRSEEKYRSLVESAEDFIFTVNFEGKFQSMNSFTATFFGGSPRDFMGKELAVLFTDELAAKQLKLVKLVYDTGKSVRDEFELKIGEHQNWINANFMPLKSESGTVTSVLCIARNITEYKNLEHQLINAEKLASLGTLAAGVAHEINNPMGVILGFCDLLLEKAEKGGQTYEDLKIIERQGLHCKKVVENLLSFARMNKESSEYADLNQCIGEIVHVVAHTLEMNDIEIITDLGSKIPPVRGDSRQLQQVFFNLISNAAAAMEYGGVLTIHTKLEKGSRRAVVQFRDTGTGIASQHMDRIFEPFFTTKPEGEGTGLGLFVSYGIVAKYGGTIDCVSHTANTAKGGAGTTFTIMLPIGK
ncbi:MAG: ATP-binding protein [Desulfobacteraceae bacterium]|nr:ATP-binding protein [Desulfobacteraceae bacterium]